MLPAKKNLVI